MPRPDRSRAALLDAAATLFRRQGFAATGVNQILETAEVKAGSLYHHFPDGKQQLAAAVVDSVGGDIEALLRRFLATTDTPVADIVGGWIDLLAAGLAGDHRDGCPIEPIATESVNASAAVRTACARVFDGWCAAIAERLRTDGWPAETADRTALSVIALIEGALILARISGGSAALDAAKAAVPALLARS